VQPLENVRKKFSKHMEEQKHTEKVKAGEITVRVTHETVSLADPRAQDEEFCGEELEDEDWL
jgi:hypothetical protein